MNAILSLNTIAHIIGSAGVGAESIKIFGEKYFGVFSAILTLLILVLSEIIPKTIGASYWRSLAMPATKIIKVLIITTYPLVLLSELITKVFTPKENQVTMSREEVSAMVDVGTTEDIFREDESVYQIWEKMLEKREHISIIVDEYRSLRGVVSMEDIIETMTGVEIVDEDDVAVDMQLLAKEKSVLMTQSKK